MKTIFDMIHHFSSLFNAAIDAYPDFVISVALNHWIDNIDNWPQGADPGISVTLNLNLFSSSK